MKKFIALLMALVMTMSLATVAWGDVTPISSDDELKTLTAGGEYTVSTTIEIDEEITIKNVTITTTVEDAFKVVAGGKLTLGEGVEINGSNTILFVNGGSAVIDGAVLNLTSDRHNSGVYVNNSGSIEFKDGAISGNSITLCVDGGSSAIVSGGSITSVNESALAAMGGSNVTISGSAELTSKKAAAYATGGATITVDGGKLTSTNSAALIAAKFTESTGGKVIMNNGTVQGVLAHEVAGASATITGGTVTGNVGAKTGATVEIKGGTVTGAVTEEAGSTVSITGGEFAVAPDAQYLPAGKTPVLTTDGTYVLGTVAATGDKFDLYLADAGMKAALAAGAEDVPALSFTNMSANTNQDGSGNLAYIAASNGEYFVKTTAPTVADFAVTVAGKTDVLYYVTVVDLADVQYYATAKAFTNFGTKCGQLYKVDTTKEYYVIEKAETGFALAKDDVSYVVLAGGVNVLVGNEIKTLAATPVDDSNTVLTIDEILGHNWAVTGVKATTTGKTIPTQVTCLNCGTVVTKFYDAATKVPAGTVATAVPGYAGGFFVEPAATVSGGIGAGTTTGGTVTSAETFDAGIALYVGMSVMAAAGSAVVLKKKD